MELKPTTDYMGMKDAAIAQLGLRAGQRHHEGLLTEGALNNDSMFVLVGEVSDGAFRELGRDGWGRDWKQFVRNVDPSKGKIATVVEFRMDTIDAAFHHLRDLDEDDPRGWTGGVYFLVRAEMPDGTWREWEIGGAASGAQGHFDMSIMYVILTTMGAAFAQREIALFKLAHA